MNPCKEGHKWRQLFIRGTRRGNCNGVEKINYSVCGRCGATVRRGAR